MSCCGCILSQSTLTPMEKILKEILNFNKVSILEYTDVTTDIHLLEELDKEFCLFIERTIIVTDAEECIYRHLDNIEKLLSKIDVNIGEYLSVKLRFIIALVVMRWGFFVDIESIENLVDSIDNNVSSELFIDYLHTLYSKLS